MRCPRCDDVLVKYTYNGDENAVVCEGCGYADISASHHGDIRPLESWNDAFDRFKDSSGQSIAQRQRLSDAVTVPRITPDERTTIDAKQLDETGVSVGTTLRDNDSKTDSEPTDESLQFLGHEKSGSNFKDADSMQDSEVTVADGPDNDSNVGAVDDE